MRHLGDLTAAFVDDQLDDADQARALAHLAGCATCRAEVQAQQQLKSRLTALADPQVPGDLSARLLDLPGRRGERSGPVGFRGPAGGPSVGGPGRSRRPRLRADGRRPTRWSSRGQHHSLRVAAASAASIVVGSLAIALAVGSPSPAAPTVTPAVDRYLYEHAATTDEVPLVDPGVAAVSVSYAGAGGP